MLHGNRRTDQCCTDVHGHERPGGTGSVSMRPRLPCIPRQPTVWAKLKRIDTERIRHELDARKIVIITGFQGH